ncbi:MAG: hypothetical protein PHE88_04110 [Elusimicrobia bacterium]|nr:hypothetical protein [Elusimicrobiota bacterium]
MTKPKVVTDSLSEKKSIFKHPLFLVIVGAISTIIFQVIFLPEKKPNIIPLIIVNTGLIKEEKIGDFEVPNLSDKIPYVKIIVKNEGTKEDYDLETMFRLLLKDNVIVSKEIKYNPETLEKNIKVKDYSPKCFYQKIECIQVNSNIEYEFRLKNYIKEIGNDYSCSVNTKSRNWNIITQINPKTESNSIFIKIYNNIKKKVKRKSNINSLKFSLNLFGTNNLCAETGQATNKPWLKDLPASGILIGEYDPITLSNSIFIMTYYKGFITQKDAEEIKKIVESEKRGVLFGGINILKFAEVFINKLIQNKYITIQQADEVLKSSQEVGGVLVGGYNIIVLEIEILNKLLENGFITLEEGQEIVNVSRKIVKQDK